MARKPSRGANIRAPFSASSTLPVKATKSKPKRKLDPTNAYTYLPALPKRSRTNEAQLSLSKDEAGPSSPRRRRDDDDDEEEDMEERVRKLAMKIADEEVGNVDSDESDIDSDEAWAEDGSDEERWGDVFRDLEKGKNKGKGVKGKVKAKEVVMKPAKPFTVNLSETEDESDPEVERSPKTAFNSAFPDEEMDDESEEDGDEDLEGSQEEEEEEEEEDDDDDEDDDLELPSDLSDDDEDDPSALDDLDAFVDQLAAVDKKRKTEADGRDEKDEKKKRRVLPVASGPALTAVSDFGLKSNQKLDLSTLINSHPSLAAASALLPSKADKKTSSQILKQGVLSAPLPTVVQDRLDREAAYEKTKEEGQKWAGVMKRIKEAEHLSFPLQADDRGGVKTSGEMVSTFKPENKMESAVTALLNAANLTDKNLTQHEDDALKAQDLSIEEIAARRAELRHQRELMFRAEARSKRVAKIKSKTFRKLARKRDAKNGGEISLEDMERLDPERAEEEREKLERDRARERATLRHGARSGKWARDVGGDAEEMEDRRREKEEMLDIKERLQRKIHGKGDAESSDEEDSEEEEDDDEDAVKSRAFDQLNGLSKKDVVEDSGKGLMGMAFMKKAQEREMKKVAEQEQDLRREIQLFGEDGNGSDEASEDGEEEAHMLRVGGNEGRMVFSGPAGLSSASTLQGDSAPEPSTASTFSFPPPKSAEPVNDNHNPWLVSSTSTAGPSRKRNTVLTANSKAADKTSKAIKKAVRGGKEDDETVEIDVDSRGLSGNKDEASDDEDDLLPIKGIQAFKQRDLVAEAFAGDNVVEDFAQEKQRQIEADAPKVEDTSLPGWGSWGGKGAKKRKTDPRFLKTTAGILPQTRKDFSRSNVIISEKKDKKASQFLVKDLPYPYTSVAQYEASLRTPVGSEWNSRIGYQRETMPRIQKKAGAIIEPIRRMF